jgi:tetratricopeptide (TPR) repeat protein
VLEVSPENISLRQTVIEAFKRNRNFYRAYLQMDSLRNSSRLLPIKYFEYAELAMLGGDFQKAKTSIADIVEIFPDSMEAVIALQFNLDMLEGNKDRVIEQFNRLVKNKPSDYNAWYGLVRMYAQTKQNKQAVVAMKNALKNGFPYGNLLVNDPSLAALREVKEFKSLYENKIPFIKYEE